MIGADLAWSASWVLMGLRYEKNLVDRLLKGVREMKESSTYQGAVQEGIELGRQEGIQKGLDLGMDRGKVEEARGIVLRVGGMRLGEPDGATRRHLLGLEDREALEQIILRLFEARTWDEALGRT